MSKYQVFKDAVQSYQPDAADIPLLFSTTEHNEKAFKTLLGRKTKSKKIIITVTVFAIAFLAGGLVGGLLAGGQGTFPAPIAFFVIILYYFRDTLISVGDQGFDFYLIAAPLTGSKYTVYDKVSLPFDKITGIQTRVGSFSTKFKFEFSHEGKTYKIKASVSNKKRKMPEQETNMKLLMEAVEKF